MVTKFHLFFPYSILKPLEREKKNDPTKNRIKLICVCFNFIAFNKKSLEHWVGWDPPKIIQFFTVTAKVKIKN
jgi:hypothetical protein